MKISLCIICKNEERRITRCIDSVKEVVDEIVVVDTGSTDCTLEIVGKMGVKLYQIPWKNNFSIAKNYAITQSTGDWIVFLDADEYFLFEHAAKIRKLIKEASKQKKEYILCEMINLDGDKILGTFKTVRIFKRGPEVRYEGRIHEKLVKQGGGLEGIHFVDELKIFHDGYTAEVMQEKKKVDRNLEILLEEIEERPQDSDLYYYLMQTYNEKNDVEKVWEYGHKAIKCDNWKIDGAQVETYERLLNVCSMIDKDFLTINQLYIDAIEKDEFYPDFEFWYAEYFFQYKDYEQGATHFALCLEKIDKYRGYAGSKIMGNMGIVLNKLADCYLLQEKYNEAIPIIVKILRLNLYDFKALYNLIKILETSGSGERIGQFLSDLYDYSNIKDQMVLAQISQKAQNQSLFNYIICRADDAIKLKFNSNNS